MGGRGAYYSGKSKDYALREYDTIDTVAGVKVLEQRDKVKPMSLPMHSNTSDMYLIVDRDGVLKHLGIYKDNNLVRSIDFEDDDIHAHEWETIDDPKGGYPVTKRKGGQHKRSSLTDNEKELIKKIKKDLEDGQHGKIKVTEGFSQLRWDS